MLALDPTASRRVFRPTVGTLAAPPAAGCRIVQERNFGVSGVAAVSRPPFRANGSKE